MGHLKPEEVEPLHVFVRETPGGGQGLYSRSNRRLVALLMLQAVRRDVLVRASCFIHTEEDASRNPKLQAWFEHGYDGPDTMNLVGCNGRGLSIFSRAGVSRHRGAP